MAFLSATATVVAQQYTISTVAGGVPPPTPAPASSLAIGPPQSVTVDAAGNVYFVSLNCVFKLDKSGTLTRVAGNSRVGGNGDGDGGPALNAQLGFALSGLTVDSAGNVYILDSERVRKISTEGIITTVAGNGTCCTFVDGGPAIGPTVFYGGLAVDARGNLYAPQPSTIIKISPAGTITKVAGGTQSGYSGDGGPATAAQLSYLIPAIAIDPDGNIYFIDQLNFRVRKVSPDGVITTVAGNGVQGYSGDGGPATDAQLSFQINDPAGIAVDGEGNLFFTDGQNNRLRKVSAGGIISTVATQFQPTGIAIDASANLYMISYGSDRVFQIGSSGTVTAVAGSGTCCYSGDGAPATNAQLYHPFGVATDSVGNVYFTDLGNNLVRKVAPDGIITTVAGGGGNYPGDGGPATKAALNVPDGITVDAAGNVYFTDSDDSRIRKVSASGIITTVAGNGTLGFSGDGGQATSAQIGAIGVAADGAGNLYIAETQNNRVRKVSQDGIITTVAGNGVAGLSGDGGPAISAQLNFPVRVTVDAAGNLYISDSGNCRIRKVSTNGTITTIAGGPVSNYCLLDNGLGDGGPATSVIIEAYGMSVDAAGNLYFAALGSNLVRKVSPDGILTTLAGTITPYGTAGQVIGYSGDGGPATDARLYYPSDVSVDGSGNIYVADSQNNAIRLLRTPQSGQSSSVGVANAASGKIGSVSPGEIIALYGPGIGPPQLASSAPSSAGIFPTQTGDTQVLFDGIASPVIYSSVGQAAAIVPYEVSGATSMLQVQYLGQTVATQTVAVSATAPGIFSANASGAGQAAALNQDLSLNTAANPAKPGSVIVLYATGEGQTSPGGVDGKIDGNPAPRPIQQVQVTIGGLPATVLYAGGSTGLVAGLMQVNAMIPSSTTPGSTVPVAISVGGVSSQSGITIAVSK